jgi:hypothetical protein
MKRPRCWRSDCRELADYRFEARYKFMGLRSWDTCLEHLPDTVEHIEAVSWQLGERETEYRETLIER